MAGNYTGGAPGTIDRRRDRAADMAAYDRLPASVQDILNHTDVPFTCISIECQIKRHGLPITLRTLLRHLR